MLHDPIQACWLSLGCPGQPLNQPVVKLQGVASCWVVHDKCICCSQLALWGCISVNSCLWPGLSPNRRPGSRRPGKWLCLLSSLPTLTLTRGGSESGERNGKPHRPGTGWDGDWQARPCSSIACPPYRITCRGPKLYVEEAGWTEAPSLALSSS